MDEFEALRREIEVRLMRETIYKAIKAFKDGYDLTEDMVINERMMRHIGDFLRSDPKEYLMWWEDYINEVFPGRFKEEKIETQGTSQVEPLRE